MKKLCIPPLLILYCIISMVLLYLFLPEYNVIIFPYNLAGLIISLLGVVLAGKARDQFKKYETTLKIEESSHLIADGIFSKTRNPMYLAMSILILGLSIVSTNLLALILPILFLLLVRLIHVPAEEKLMQQVFGKEYEEYKKNVRRWF